VLKRAIADLVARGERRVLYYAFDLDRRPDDIIDVLRRARGLHPEPDGPWYLFLDEVTSIPDWGLGVKYAWDQGLTREDLLVLTGSSARDLETNREYLPGRRGTGARDLVQLPMSFRDFCRRIMDVSLPEETVSLDDLLSADGERLLKTVNLQIQELARALDVYVRVGGFPAAVHDYQLHGRVQPETIAMIWTAIAGEVQRAGRDQLAALKLMDEVNTSLGTPLKWVDAARSMDVASHTTAKAYATLLAQTFTLMTVFFWDLSGGNLNPQAERKQYFMDPLLAQVATTQIRGARPAPDDGLIENLAAIGLFRSAATQLTQSEPSPGTIAYWRSSNRREIDFLAAVDATVSRAQRFPVEVKGDSVGRLSKARSAISKSFGAGLVTSRTAFDWNPKVPIVPLPVLLAVLREHPEREPI
jgi:predicted AAA+ superfamily ATPase